MLEAGTGSEDQSLLSAGGVACGVLYHNRCRAAYIVAGDRREKTAKRFVFLVPMLHVDCVIHQLTFVCSYCFLIINDVL